jgi:hypothetical protein
VVLPTHIRIRIFYSVILVLVFLPPAECITQDKFVLTPTTPSDTETTWLDYFTTVSKVHIDLPQGLSVPGLQTDSSKATVLLLARKLRLFTKEGSDAQTLQVSYLRASELTGISLPSSETAPTDLGAALQSKVYEINCKSGAVTVDSSTTSAPDQEARIVRRECANIQRAPLMSQLFGGMGIGDIKLLTAGEGSSLFTEEVDQFKIKSWDIKLRVLSVGPPMVATFDISAKADTSTPVGKSFPDYKGELVLDEKAMLMELRLNSTTTHSETMPDGKSQIISKGDLTIRLRRQVNP